MFKTTDPLAYAAKIQVPGYRHSEEIYCLSSILEATNSSDTPATTHKTARSQNRGLKSERKDRGVTDLSLEETVCGSVNSIALGPFDFTVEKIGILSICDLSKGEMNFALFSINFQSKF
jgi:hypothetical protein